MAFDGSELIDNPWETIFSPFTDLFSRLLSSDGLLFWIFPILFIGGALFVKTRDMSLFGLYLITASALFGGTGIFIGAMDIIPVFLLLAGGGMALLVVDVLLGGR